MSEPVVFIHGLYQGMGHLADLPFPSSRKLILLDLPGYRTQVEKAVPPDLAGYADHVASELDRLGASPAVVVGHSVGGAVAMGHAISGDAPISVTGAVPAGGAVRHYQA